jgi:nitrite reductase (NADH) small subunit
MANFVRAAALADCPPGNSLEVVVGERIVALFNVEGRIYAIDGVCAHQGGPLGKGRLTGSTVTCPWHGWQYDVCTGRHCLSSSIVQPQFLVRIEDDAILVDVDASPGSAAEP